ncbi:hypothetical protein NQ315_008103 [Exocentrus adspersus]|uniref:Uncharacterized protein n=1 Tax=Exocentrus adspersus TaxID=1586481 RepID=A0AAV8VVK5_9CUCU|nr:hypothetical protein NQ315_008103 [Exocentrus adspersus]
MQPERPLKMTKQNETLIKLFRPECTRLAWKWETDVISLLSGNGRRTQKNIVAVCGMAMRRLINILKIVSNMAHKNVLYYEAILNILYRNDIYVFNMKCTLECLKFGMRPSGRVDGPSSQL